MTFSSYTNYAISPPKESNKKYGVGILSLYPIFQASRIALTVDKTIAHTNLDNIEKLYNKYKVDIYQWCGAIVVIFTVIKFCENLENEDNFNNTISLTKSSCYHYSIEVMQI